MKSLMLWLCMLATSVSITGCDIPECPEEDKYIGGWDCSTTGSVTSCQPQWYCSDAEVNDVSLPPPCTESTEFGCEPFVDCMPTKGGWNYIKSKKVRI